MSGRPYLTQPALHDRYVSLPKHRPANPRPAHEPTGYAKCHEHLRDTVRLHGPGSAGMWGGR